jgi:hypothetical protein
MGRLVVVASLGLWVVWLAWRVTSPMTAPLGIAVLVLELVAIAVAVVVSAALWTAAPGADARTRTGEPILFAQAFAAVVGADAPAPADRVDVNDDAGEVVWARRALWSLRATMRGERSETSLAGLAWSLVAIEGIRRMLCIGVVVAVLLSGSFPFEVPPVPMLVVLAASQCSLTIGHWMLSRGAIRPGARLRWSMASVGAGFGDGRSRTGLPIRWAATLATMVSLNLAVSLRGTSDRWTHGLGAMPRDERIAAMFVAAWFVAWGFVALRSMTQPQLGYYGATRRLEEVSTRRLALGTTLTVAAVGLVAGILPGGVPA